VAAGSGRTRRSRAGLCSAHAAGTPELQALRAAPGAAMGTSSRSLRIRSRLLSGGRRGLREALQPASRLPTGRWSRSAGRSSPAALCGSRPGFRGYMVIAGGMVSAGEQQGVALVGRSVVGACGPGRGPRSLRATAGVSRSCRLRRRTRTCRRRSRLDGEAELAAWPGRRWLVRLTCARLLPVIAIGIADPAAADSPGWQPRRPAPRRCRRHRCPASARGGVTRVRGAGSRCNTRGRRCTTARRL
jgi:hypothetical protein